MIEGMDDPINGLTDSQQEAAIECLAALEAGVDIEVCLERRTEHAESLRPLLELRAQLLASSVPAPPAAAVEAGRDALMERVTARAESRAGWSRMRLIWARFPSPLARVAAAAAGLVLLLGGALGVSAGAGFEPARNALSTLPVIDLPSTDDEPADGRAADHPTAGPTQAPAGASPTPGDAQRPNEVPGVGLCFPERESGREGAPQWLLVRVPDVGLCIPERLLQRSESGQACIPGNIAQQLADIVGDTLGDLPICAPTDTGPPPGRTEPPPTALPPADDPTGQPATAPPPMGPQGPSGSEERGEPQQGSSPLQQGGGPQEPQPTEERGETGGR